MQKRSLPDWMKTTALEESNENKSDNAESQPRRRLRSNFSFDHNPIKVVQTVKPQDYPPIEYKGKIVYHTQMVDIAFECDQLTTWLNNHPDDVVPVAFDMEWPFSFKTGPKRSAVIQLCHDVDVCHVFHISELKKLPLALLELLTHKKILMHGVNIKNDFRKLQRDFPEANSDVMIEKCRDLGVWCNSILDTSGRWSLERLVQEICQLKIDKNKLVRMSQWHVQPLSDAQKIYAAIDVYISQVIFHDLQKREIEKEKQIDAFIKEYGEDALNTLDKLR